MSIDVLAGYAGRTSLCHGAIFGVSTYVVIYWTADAGLPPLVAYAARRACGHSAGRRFRRCSPCARRGVYFLLLTLALGMIVWGVCLRWTQVTGGENGMRGVVAGADIIADPRASIMPCLLRSSIFSFAMWRFVQLAVRPDAARHPRQREPHAQPRL